MYQTADVVILLLNHGMKGAAGECKTSIYGWDKGDYRMAIFTASYSKNRSCSITFLEQSRLRKNYQEAQNLKTLTYFIFSVDGWLFAHEAGHCIGGMHVRPKGKN